MFHLHDLADINGAAFWFDPAKVVSIVLIPWRETSPGRLSIRLRGTQHLDTWVNQETSTVIAGILSASSGALIDHGIGASLLLLDDPEEGQIYQAVNPRHVQAGRHDKSSDESCFERLVLIYDEGTPQAFLVKSGQRCLQRLRTAVRNLNPNLNGGL